MQDTATPYATWPTTVPCEEDPVAGAIATEISHSELFGAPQVRSASGLGLAVAVHDILPDRPGDEVLLQDLPGDEPPVPHYAVHLVGEQRHGLVRDVAVHTFEHPRWDFGRFGERLSAGDSDGDGSVDLAIASPGEGNASRGIVYLFRGPFQLGSLPDASQWTARIAGDDLRGAGASIVFAGDWLGNGESWLAVGGTGVGRSDDLGEVAFFDGASNGQIPWDRARARITATQPRSILGAEVDLSRDATGDGLPDMLLSTWDVGPAAYLVAGGRTPPAVIDDADATYALEEGSSVRPRFVGDLDGDGHVDAVVGVPIVDLVDRDGEAFLLWGPLPTGRHAMADVSSRIVPSRPGDVFAYSLLGPGDLDGDGVDDLVIGAMGNPAGTQSAGVAYVFRGPLVAAPDVDDADLVLAGDCRGEFFGNELAAGDLDGDDKRDLVIGAPGAQVEGWSFGKVKTFLGADLTW